MKQYLGDAVYYDVDNFGDVVLTTENGVSATNTIVLEPRVISAFLSALGNDDGFDREKLRKALGK